MQALFFSDAQSLEVQRHMPMRDLLEHVASGGTNAAALSSLASRLARLDKQCGLDEIDRVVAAGGSTLQSLSKAIVSALDEVSAARHIRIPVGEEPTEQEVKRAAEVLLKKAVEPLATKPVLRQLVQDLKRQLDQIIEVLDSICAEPLLATRSHSCTLPLHSRGVGT